MEKIHLAPKYLIIILFLLSPNPSPAKAPDASVTYQLKRGTTLIPKLQFMEPVSDLGSKFILLKGSHLAKRSSLLINFEIVKKNKDGNFEAKVLLNSNGNQIEVREVDLGGQILQETLTLVLQVKPLPTPSPGKVLARAPSKKPLQLRTNSAVENRYTAGLSISSISYSESSVPSLSELALTLKGNATRHFSARWDASVSGYITGLPLTSNVSPQARFLGLNFRGGYAPPSFFENPNLLLTLNGGVYYTTMFVIGKAYGFHDLSGPQFFPAFAIRRSNGSIISTYAKYSLVSKSWTSLSTASREIAAGLAYSWVLKNQKQIALSFDISNLSLFLSQGSTEVGVHASSISLGASYGW